MYVQEYYYIMKPVYYGHLEINQKCPDYQGVLIFEVSYTVW